MDLSQFRSRTLNAAVLVLFTGGAPAYAQTQQWSGPAYTQQWSAPPAAEPSAPNGRSASPSACPAGAAVEVFQGGKWYKAKILRGPDRMGTCLVSYDGYASNWDEWVAPDRIRSGVGSAPPPSQPAPAPTRPEAGGCAVGAAVEVLYGGEWYKARILKGPDGMGTCLVSYDGYGSNWDEWVAPKRIRPIDGGGTPAKPAPVPGKPTPSKPAPSKPLTGAASVPPGTYTCYTLDSGQMNYAYNDVVVRDGGRYAVGAKEGRYTLAANGDMSFTGPLSNAAGRYSMKNTGRSQIDLVFNGDNRSSMACTRR